MTKYTPQVFLNRFPVKKLSDAEKTVQVYSYTFNPSPEPGKEYSAINQIPWKIRTPGVRFKSTIITKQVILDKQNGIPEYWVIDLPHNKLWIFTQPQQNAYLKKREVITGNINPVLFPGTNIEVGKILPNK